MPGICKKVVIVGEDASGKTSLSSVFCMKYFPEVYFPTIAETTYTNIEAEGEQVKLDIWDTAGDMCHNSVRTETYPKTDVLIMCFAIDQPNSLWKVAHRWKPEVKRYCPGVPIVLVGNKKDLRFDEATVERLAENKQVPVYADHGQAMAHTIGAYTYVECSAKQNEGVTDVFQIATRAAMEKKKKKGKECTLL